MSHNSENFFSIAELKSMGLRSAGNNPRISRKASFHQLSGTIGDEVRIDDYCVITGNIEFGDHVHIAPFCLLIGTGAPIKFGDCSGLSSHCALYTSSDDYRAAVLSNPTVPEEHKNITSGPIEFGIGAIAGSHSVILPNVKIGNGASIGAHCIIYKDIHAGAICVSGTRKTEIAGQRDVKAIESLAAKLCRDK